MTPPPFILVRAHAPRFPLFGHLSFFDHNGLMGQAIFINEKSDDQSIASGSGSRGRKMWSLGVLVA